MTMKKADRNFGFADWTGTHYNFYSTFDITLSSGKTAHATIFFKYDKTNGIWAQGRKGWFVNGVIAAANMATKLKHVISKVIISTDIDYLN